MEVLGPAVAATVLLVAVWLVYAARKARRQARALRNAGQTIDHYLQLRQLTDPYPHDTWLRDPDTGVLLNISHITALGLEISQFHPDQADNLPAYPGDTSGYLSYTRYLTDRLPTWMANDSSNTGVYRFPAVVQLTRDDDHRIDVALEPRPTRAATRKQLRNVLKMMDTTALLIASGDELDTVIGQLRRAELVAPRPDNT